MSPESAFPLDPFRGLLELTQSPLGFDSVGVLDSQIAALEVLAIELPYLPLSLDPIAALISSSEPYDGCHGNRLLLGLAGKLLLMHPNPYPARLLGDRLGMGTRLTYLGYRYIWGPTARALISTSGIPGPRLVPTFFLNAPGSEWGWGGVGWEGRLLSTINISPMILIVPTPLHSTLLLLYD